MRPSNLLDIDDPYISFCLDQAIGYFGSTIQNEIEAVEGKTAKQIEAKQKAILKKYLSPQSQPKSGQFADPALFFK